MSDKLIHIPLYVKEMLARFTELPTMAERGAYLSLMVAYIQNDGNLPDDESLFFKTMCFSDEDKQVLKQVLKIFDEHELMHIMHKQKELREKRRSAGKAGGVKSRKIINKTGKQMLKQKGKQNVSKPMLKQSESESESDIELDSSSNPPIVSPQGEIDLEFESWWKIYPRKIGKQAAKKEFVKARKSIELEQLIEGVKRYASNLNGTEQRFIKHGRTWLSQGCWDDDYESGKELATSTPGAKQGDSYFDSVKRAAVQAVQNSESGW